jgi:hypothetical protein
MTNANGPFSAGFISGSQANALNEMYQLLQSQKRNASNNGLNNNLNTIALMYPSLNMFRAKLTGYDEATGYFDWIEQTYEVASGGAPYDKPFGRSGTYLLQPAKLMPGLPVPSDVSPYNPVQCVMVEKGVTQYKNSKEYEIIFLAQSSVVRIVTGVCPTIVSGMVTGITVESQLWSLFGEPIYDPSCELNPEDCCDDIDILVPCCGDIPVPSQFTLTMQGEVAFSCLNGIKICYEYSTTAIECADAPGAVDGYVGGWVPISSSADEYSLITTGIFRNHLVLRQYGCFPSSPGTYTEITAPPIVCDGLNFSAHTYNSDTIPACFRSTGAVRFFFLNEALELTICNYGVAACPCVCEPLFLEGSGLCLPSIDFPEGSVFGFTIEPTVAGDCDPTSECTACVPCPDGDSWIVEGDDFYPLNCGTPTGDLDCIFTQFGSTVVGWSLWHDTALSEWVLYNPFGGSPVTYTMPDASFDCAGPNTFTDGVNPDITITRP